jgi:hypothetical protein
MAVVFSVCPRITLGLGTLLDLRSFSCLLHFTYTQGRESFYHSSLSILDFAVLHSAVLQEILKHSLLGILSHLQINDVTLD